MLVSWENKAGLDGAEGSKDKAVFKELLSDFWEGLGLLLVSHGDDKDADPKVLEGVATMLQVQFFVFFFGWWVEGLFCDNRFRLICVPEFKA